MSRSSKAAAFVGLAAFLIESGLQVSDFHNLYVAVSLYGVAGVALIWAAVLWIRERRRSVPMPPKIAAPLPAAPERPRTAGIRIAPGAEIGDLEISRLKIGGFDDAINAEGKVSKLSVDRSDLSSKDDGE